MTPFELSLDRELQDEWRSFANGWLFKWFNISGENGRFVDVDRFDGGRIQMGGVLFEGQPQQVYWDAIDRYLRQKIHETFKRWDIDTVKYSAAIRQNSIDGVERSLRSFCYRIIAHAVDTDRRLRGKGFPQNVPPYIPDKHRVLAKEEIGLVGAARRKLLGKMSEAEKAPPLTRSYAKFVEEFYANNKGLIWLSGALIGAITLAANFWGR